MTTTVSEVQTEVGRPLTPAEVGQAELWIADTARLIERRLGSLALLDAEVVDQVIRQAVARRIKRPDDVTQKSVTVDGDTVQRSYQTSRGIIEIYDEEWELLAPDAGIDGAVFSIAPSHEPDRRGRCVDW